MPKRFAFLIMLLLAVFPAAAPAAAPRVTDATLDRDLTRLAARAGGSGGFVVLDGRTGRTLAAERPDTVRPLGSTAKLLTLGAAARYFPAGVKTTAYVTGPSVAGVVQGDIVLRGGGDPTLDEAKLAALADQLKVLAVGPATGSVVGDESLLDAVRGGPTTGGAFDPELGGVLGALTYDRGRQAPGGPLQPDPARAAAFRFDDLLEQRGANIGGVPRAGVLPPGAVEEAHVGTPIGHVIRAIGKPSDDFGAEVLAKDVAVAAGRPGTTADGAAAIAADARAVGARVTLADGSGVDPASRAAPRQMARYLRAVIHRPGPRSRLAYGLSGAGVDGTLATRMASGPAKGHCHAKTGSLPQTRVSALTGWCRTNRRTVYFAIQRERVDQAAAKAAEDAMVQRIAASRKR
jgi:serine-type D-Ala-D-Ala carboxypeptidase/endopeptidase (penicillin-binding protein 4)